jgi:hypothetical protein
MNYYIIILIRMNNYIIILIRMNNYIMLHASSDIKSLHVTYYGWHDLPLLMSILSLYFQSINFYLGSLRHNVFLYLKYVLTKRDLTCMLDPTVMGITFRCAVNLIYFPSRTLNTQQLYMTTMARYPEHSRRPIINAFKYNVGWWMLGLVDNPSEHIYTIIYTLDLTRNSY